MQQMIWLLLCLNLWSLITRNPHINAYHRIYNFSTTKLFLNLCSPIALSHVFVTHVSFYKIHGTWSRNCWYFKTDDKSQLNDKRQEDSHAYNLHDLHYTDKIRMLIRMMPLFPWLLLLILQSHASFIFNFDFTHSGCSLLDRRR